LGIKTLIPIHCKRSIVDILNKSDVKIEKWDTIAIEASKQCKRSFVTKIEDAMLLNDLMKTVCDYDLPLIACTESHTKTLKNVLDEHASAKKIICLIGTEGGFTNSEAGMAGKAGCMPVSVGLSILRIETAAVAIPPYYSMLIL